MGKGGFMVVKDDNIFPGQEIMGEEIKKRLRRCGKNVKIYPLAKIADPHMVEIGDNCIIDDYTFIEGGKGIKLGKYVHISCFSSIIGGGTLEMGDFSGLSAGCRIITGSDDFSGRSMTNPCVPLRYKPFCGKGYVKIGRHTILGTNTIVHMNVTIGEGCATGSNTLVTKDLEPWGIYIGTPAKRAKDRKMDLLEIEKELNRGSID